MRRRLPSPTAVVRAVSRARVSMSSTARSAARRALTIFTTGEDFERYARILPLTLHPKSSEKHA